MAGQNPEALKPPDPELQGYADMLRLFLEPDSNPETGKPPVYVYIQVQNGNGLVKIDPGDQADEIRKKIRGVRKSMGEEDGEPLRPGINVYVSPFDLGDEVGWTYHREMGQAFKEQVNMGHLERQIEAALSSEDEEEADEKGKMMERVMGDMARLQAAALLSGPTILPHFHANVSLGMDEYGLMSLNLGSWQRGGKSPEQAFKEKYPSIEFDKIFNVRYMHLKPGTIRQRLENHFRRQVAESLGGYTLEQIERDPQLSEEVAAKVKEFFKSFVMEYLGHSLEEFREAYEARIQLLKKQADEAVVELARRLGLTAIISKDIDTGHLVSSIDFPSGGKVLFPDNYEEGKQVNEMVVAYPPSSS